MSHLRRGAASFKLTGNLTLLNVTRPVSWDFAGSVNGNEVRGKATTTFTFEDFNLNRPQAPVVLSIEDHITLEVDLTLQRQGFKPPRSALRVIRLCYAPRSAEQPNYPSIDNISSQYAPYGRSTG